MSKVLIFVYPMCMMFDAQYMYLIPLFDLLQKMDRLSCAYVRRPPMIIRG